VPARHTSSAGASLAAVPRACRLETGRPHFPLSPRSGATLLNWRHTSCRRHQSPMSALVVVRSNDCPINAACHHGRPSLPGCRCQEISGAPSYFLTPGPGAFYFEIFWPPVILFRNVMTSRNGMWPQKWKCVTTYIHTYIHTYTHTHTHTRMHVCMYVVTHLRRDGIFNDCFIANFLETVPVKEFSKSVNIWWRYELEYAVYFLLTHMQCSCWRRPRSRPHELWLRSRISWPRDLDNLQVDGNYELSTSFSLLSLSS